MDNKTFLKAPKKVQDQYNQEDPQYLELLIGKNQLKSYDQNREDVGGPYFNQIINRWRSDTKFSSQTRNFFMTGRLYDATPQYYFAFWSIFNASNKLQRFETNVILYRGLSTQIQPKIGDIQINVVANFSIRQVAKEFATGANIVLKVHFPKGTKYYYHPWMNEFEHIIAGGSFKVTEIDLSDKNYTFVTCQYNPEGTYPIQPVSDTQLFWWPGFNPNLQIKHTFAIDYGLYYIQAIAAHYKLNTIKIPKQSKKQQLAEIETILELNDAFMVEQGRWFLANFRYDLFMTPTFEERLNAIWPREIFSLAKTEFIKRMKIKDPKYPFLNLISNYVAKPDKPKPVTITSALPISQSEHKVSSLVSAISTLPTTALGIAIPKPQITTATATGLTNTNSIMGQFNVKLPPNPTFNLQQTLQALVSSVSVSNQNQSTNTNSIVIKKMF
jgi:hypothetical protein